METIKFEETRFDLLMQKRMHRILIVTSVYDAFGLEEDGRIEEQIFKEYRLLNLRYPPRILHAETAEKALRIMKKTYIDMVITMLNVGQKTDAFSLAEKIKKQYPNKPIVVLTPYSREVSIRLQKENLDSIDYKFSWLGSADVLLAIIKLIEDKNNVDRDIKAAGVQTILLVEDSVRYYSGYLTNMYKIIFTQTKKFMEEGLNEHKRMLRMRGRPKILLATNYEEAIELYEKYKDNMLGIISDVKYEKDGEMDHDAGIKFVEEVKKDNKYLPILLQSSRKRNRERAKKLRVGFIHKRSENVVKELRNFMNKYFAFGPFIFRDPNTKQEIARAYSLKDFRKVIYDVTDESFEYHISRNHISKWLKARALFSIAKSFSEIKRDMLGDDLNEIRDFVSKTISNYRKFISRGVIAEFNRNKYDETVIFSRIGNGYMGGKGRGLAFLDMLIKKNVELDSHEGVTVKIPRTVSISTEVFDDFIEMNGINYPDFAELENSEILEKFVDARLPDDFIEDLKGFLQATQYPIAIRSSSVLEDSHHQPFAGVYSTFMIPNPRPETEELDDEIFLSNLNQLQIAVKSVYASVYYKETKAYMSATHNLIDEEKMGVVLQEVCGNKYGNNFYPTFSGVARSINFYPIENEEAEDGIATIALGLGKHVVEGKKSLRFSPKYPKKILQLSSPDMALRESQKTFYAIDLNPESFKISSDDGINIKELRIRQAENDKSIYQISSVYDYENNILREGKMYEGKRVITFANVLKYNSFPLAEIIKKTLEICRRAMNNHVEIEFAVNLEPQEGGDKIFNLLQIRPIVEETANFDVSLQKHDLSDAVIKSESALGHGIIEDIYDIVYIKPENFDSANNPKIVPIIEKLNNMFIKENKNYILIGPGRWGSSDHWLGVPVKWTQISEARLIVEAGLSNYRIEASQGTHFFQNLTSFKVGYFTINPFAKDGFYDVDFLNQFEASYEDEFVRHIEFDKQLIIKIDGKSGTGIVLKPGKE